MHLRSNKLFYNIPANKGLCFLLHKCTQLWPDPTAWGGCCWTWTRDLRTTSWGRRWHRQSPVLRYIVSFGHPSENYRTLWIWIEYFWKHLLMKKNTESLKYFSSDVLKLYDVPKLSNVSLFEYYLTNSRLAQSRIYNVQ